jgi:mevalonate pyrophosphate decarboxylase
MAPRKKKPQRTRKPRTVENEEYTELEMYCIWLNEYKAGFKSELALSFVMEKSSYPSWVAYKAPTDEELKKYLDEEDED